MTGGGHGARSDGGADRAGEAGWALIETLVAAVLLVAVALAVLSSLDVANRTSGTNKARGVAGALAEQDQERMRGMTIDAISNYHATRTVTVAGASYTVASRAEWLRDSSGTPESCTNASTQADYVRITSTVTSTLVGVSIKPVTQRGIVSVPVGSLGPSQGTLAVKVVDRAGQPVAGINVAVSGPRGASDVTNDLGCAVFGYIPVGSYTAQLDQAAWVDQSRQQVSTKGATVTAGNVTTATMPYDRAASVHATFVDSTGAATAPRGATKLRMTNPSVPTGFPDVPVASGQSAVDVPSLFPFTDAYVVYAGSCDNANPGLYPPAPGATQVLNPGALWSPALTLPTMTVTVTSAGTPVVGATVKIKGNASGGCTGDTATVGTVAGGVAAVPMPYGAYDICAVSGLKSGKVAAVTPNTAPGGVSRNVTIATLGPPC